MLAPTVGATDGAGGRGMRSHCRTPIGNSRASALRRGRPRRCRTILAALGVLLGSAALAAAGPAGEPRDVRVGVYQNKPKLFIDEQGRASGLFVELLEEIARAEGWRLSYVPCRWTECLRGLDDGTLDLMPDVAYSRERDRDYDFNRTLVLESWSQLYSRSDESVRALADVNGKRVAVLVDSVQQASFEQMMAGFGFEVTIVPTESFEASFAAVRDGAADLAIANHFFGDYFHGEYGLVRTPIVFQAAQLHFVTAAGRHPELLQAIDRHLDEWRGEPNSVYYTTLARWMDRPPVGVVPGRILWIIGITFGLLVLAGGAILLLRSQVRARTRHLERANEELRRADAALRQSEAVLNSSQRLARIGGWEWDLERQTATWTEETHRIHGIRPGELAPGSREPIERSLACYEPASRGALREAFEQCCRHGLAYDLEAPFRSADGRRLWVRTTAEAVRDAEGRVVKVVGSIMDVTERRAAEDEQRSLEERLRQSQKMEAVGKLAGGVAHDFNNLLTVILNYTELALREMKADDPVRAELTEVVQAGQRAAVLTRQLLAFSRKQVLEPRPVDLNHVATDLEKMLRRIIGEDVDLRLTLATDLGVTLADPGQLEQVIMNLVVNARDAMPAGGTLTIETANADIDEALASRGDDVTAGPYVVLSVTDSGCGMDEPTRLRIFEPFFTTKERGKGTGLGLSTVYGIVKQSGGHVAVDSEPGRGSTFRVYLPRETAAVTVPARAPASSERPPGTETVLVVEDEEAVRNLAARILRSAGYSVLVAASADEAVQVAAAHSGEIRLLLTDMVMPGASGELLAERLVAARPRLKVLFMSGYFDSETVRRGVWRAGVRFVGKPFTVETLTQKVREAIEGR